MGNCKNCGAPVVGTVCQYCGTHYNKLTAVGSFPVFDTRKREPANDIERALSSEGGLDYITFSSQPETRLCENMHGEIVYVYRGKLCFIDVNSKGIEVVRFADACV